MIETEVNDIKADDIFIGLEVINVEADDIFIESDAILVEAGVIGLGPDLIFVEFDVILASGDVPNICFADSCNKSGSKPPVTDILHLAAGDQIRPAGHVAGALPLESQRSCLPS